MFVETAVCAVVGVGCFVAGAVYGKFYLSEYSSLKAHVSAEVASVKTAITAELAKIKVI